MERKARLQHGAQRRIAKKAGVAESYVSMVVNETLPPPRTERGARTRQRVRVFVARELGVRVAEAFPLPVRSAPAESDAPPLAVPA